jgi:outer membrane protein OmpA-like peptidoglycan-associated protein
MRGRLTAICLPLVCAAFIAQAQTNGELSQLVSGPIQLALAESARIAWRKLSQTEASCFDRMLHQRGLSLDLIISHGVMPNNPHLGKMKDNCTKLRSGAIQQRDTSRTESTAGKVLPSQRTTEKIDGQPSSINEQRLQSDQQARDQLFKNLQATATAYSFEYMVINLPPGSVPGLNISIPVSHIRYRETVLIAFDSFVLERSAESIVADFANTLTKDAAIRSVLVVGRTDAIGTDEYNQGLSKKRAVAVPLALRKLGIDEHFLGVVPMGKAQPIANNSSEEGRALNRRVEFFLSDVPAATRVAIEQIKYNPCFLDPNSSPNSSNCNNQKIGRVPILDSSGEGRPRATLDLSRGAIPPGSLMYRQPLPSEPLERPSLRELQN